VTSPAPGPRDGSRCADAGRQPAPEFGTTDETVSDSLGLLTGTDLKWFRNQGLIFWHDFTQKWIIE
jgi:hypothetical protein